MRYKHGSAVESAEWLSSYSTKVDGIRVSQKIQLTHLSMSVNVHKKGLLTYLTDNMSIVISSYRMFIKIT